MAVTPMTESEIIDQIYAAYENDDTTWGSSDAEYLTARRLCKAAIRRWEYLDGIMWPELFTTLDDASDGTKTVTAGTYTYACPTDMRLPPQPDEYVRTVDGTGTSAYYRVIPLAKVNQLPSSHEHFCYFTGNPKLGYTLNINPNLNLSTGDTIKYNYYRNATYFTATGSTTEMSNPFFIVHYVLWRLFKSDGQLSESTEELQIAEGLLEQMRADAMSIDSDSMSPDNDGFGI